MEDKKLTKKQRRELKKQQKLSRQIEEAKKRKMRSVFMWLLVLFVIAFASWLVMRSGGNNTEDNLTLAEQVSQRPSDPHLKGNPDGVVSIVEFSDFQCPACAYYHTFLNKIVKDLGSDISVEYRHFPLYQIHPNSILAAQASEAAALQGKFWEMHDILFTNQSEWKNLDSSQAQEKFIEYAASLGMDKDKFAADLDSDLVKEKVKEDEEQALKLGLNYTPTIFVNGLKIKNPRSYVEFKKIVESEINWNK